MIGIADGIENLFVACGFTSGIAASAGAGFAVANWIGRGEPGLDLAGLELSRFRNRRYAPYELTAAAIRAYASYYALSGQESRPPVLAARAPSASPGLLPAAAMAARRCPA